MAAETANPARSPAELLRALMEAEGGSISVERFMQEALYHPRFGYYARQVRTVGRQGDFSTTATLHPALGVAVAAWARHHRATVAAGGCWHLVELGGGTGELAAGVLKALGWRHRLGLRYHLVEVSAGLRARQQERLGAGGRACWHEEIGTALQAAGGRALIFSNEFVDAFPCVQLAREQPTGEWREVRLTWPAGKEQPQETTAEWTGERSATDAVKPSGGSQRIEMHLTYRKWLATWVDRWRGGRMLTIDYGDTSPALYGRHPLGTLRAYCRHLCFRGPEVYQRFGQQDLTADVNFADLQRWGEELGVTTARYQTQAEFFERWLGPRQRQALRTDVRFASLIDLEGAGGAFKALEQIAPQ